MRKRIIAALLCLALCLLLLTGCFLRREKQAETPAYMYPAEQYVLALQNNDYASLKRAVPLMILQNSGFDTDELASRQRALRTRYGSDLSVTIEEVDSSALTDALLAEFTEYLLETYQFRAEISEAYLISCYLTLSGKSMTENSAGYIVSFCIDDTWYLDADAFGALSGLRELIQQ